MENTYDENFEDQEKELTYAEQTLGKKRKKNKTYAESTGAKHNVKDPFANTFNRNTSSLVGTNTGYGKSKYDRSIQWAEDINPNDVTGSINEHRAQEQSALGQVGLGVNRAIIKAGAEIAKIPGVVGGIVAATGENIGDLITGKDEHAFMETAFNNPWIKTVDEINDKINTDLLPVYTAKAVKEGNLWANISSTAFWATDGADGMGFILGMMAPGAAFEYLGLGSKLIGAAANSTKLAKYTSMIGKAEEGVSALKFMGISGRTIDSGLAITSNTFLEAGAEAKGVGDDLDRKKPDFIKSYVGSQDHQQKVIKKLQDLDIQRRNGSIDINKYNELSARVSSDVAEEVFKEQRALAMRNTFVTNVGILLGPNAIMHKAIWGKAAQKFERSAEQGIKGLAKRGGKMLERWGKAGASEGFFEEGLQTTTENFNVKRAMQNKLGKKDNRSYVDQISETVGDFAKEYVNTVSSVEGQKAIFLGGALGGPMMSYQGRKEDVRNRKYTNEVLDNIDSQITNFNDIFDNKIYQQNEDGSYKYKKDKDGNDTTERLLDNKEVYNLAKSLNFSEQQSKLFDLAVQTGNTEVVDRLKREAIFNMVLPSIHNGEIGIKALEQKLKEDSKLNEIVDRDQSSDEKDKSRNFMNEILETAKYLQKQNQKFGDFSRDVIRLENENANDDQKNRFLNRLNASYLNSKHKLRANEAKLQKLEEKRNNIFDELGIDPLYDETAEFPVANMKGGKVSNDEMIARAERTKEALKNNELLATANDEYNALKKEIEKSKKDISEIWQGKNINETFDDFVKKDNELSEKTSDEAIQKADDLINKVKSSQNKDELNQALLPAHKAEPTIEEYDREAESIITDDVSRSINENDSLENLQLNLEKLKSVNINSSKISDVVKDLEEKITKKIQDRDEFKTFLSEIVDSFDQEVTALNDFMSEIDSEINDLIKQKNAIIKGLDAQDKSPRGRNAKLIKELIKDSQDALKKVEKQIEYLEGIKNEIKKELKQLDKNIEYVFNRYEQIEKTDFNSIAEIIDYLEQNKEIFKEHRHSIERLLATKLTSEEHVEYLENSIEGLEGYADALRNVIKSLLTSEGKIKNENVADHKFIKEELIKTTKALFEAKQNLKSEKEKLKRLEKSIIDKLAITSIDNELKFWNDLKTYKQDNINPLTENPYIKDIIKKKEEELNNQEVEDDLQSKQEQQDLEEEQITEDPESVEEINEVPVTLDEEGNFQSESIPTQEDEDEDVPVEDNENMSEEEVDNQLNKEVSGAKVISTNRETGETLYDNLQDFVDYERTPRDKSNDEVIFKVGDIKDKDVKSAYDKLLNGEKLSPKEIKLLEEKLPIKVMIIDDKGDGHISYLEAHSKANQSNADSKEILEQQTMPLRRNIIAEAIKNKSLEGITSSVVKQYPGLLKTDQSQDGVAMNDIFSLQVFEGMSEDEKVDYFQKNTGYVDWQGNLVSTLNKNKKIKTNFGVSHKGEVFLKIPQNNGTEFWLKLNVAKISEEKAEAVYEIVNALSQVSQTINSPTSFQAMTIDTFFDTLSQSDPELSDRLQQTLAKEIEFIKIFNKGKTQNESLSRFLDLIIYHKSANKKTAFKLNKDGSLTLGSLAMELMDGSGFQHLLTITKDELNTDTAKEVIMQYVIAKRHNILITKDSANLFIFNNKAYIKYLLDEEAPLLTTNAVVNQPTFQGYSNIYLNQDVSNSKSANVLSGRGTIAPIVKDDLEAKKDAISRGMNNSGQDKIDITEEQLIKLIEGIKPDGKMSPSFIQRMFKIGYQKALRISEKIDAELVATEDNVEPVDNSLTDEEGNNIKTMNAFSALLSAKKNPKSKEEVKTDTSMVEELFEKANEDKKAEIMFALSENLNIVIDFDDYSKDNLKTFKNLIKDALNSNHSIENINKICGI